MAEWASFRLVIPQILILVIVLLKRVSPRQFTGGHKARLYATDDNSRTFAAISVQ